MPDQFDSQRIVNAVNGLRAPLIDIEKNTSQINNITYTIKELEATVAQLNGEIERIRKNQDIDREMKISESYAKKELAQRVLNDLIIKNRERGQELEDQKNAIQHDYDKTQLEFIGNFVESVSADTDSINHIQKEYKKFEDLQEVFTSDVEILMDYEIKRYMQRKTDLKSLVVNTQKNIDHFIKKRERTAEEINHILHKKEMKRNTVVYVPFWICGVQKGNMETYRVIPPKRLSVTNQSAYRDRPYIEHLTDLNPDLKDKFINLLKSFDVIDAVRKNSVLNDRNLMTKAFNSMFNIKDFLDRSEPNGKSIFAQFLNKFIVMKDRKEKLASLTVKKVDPSQYEKAKEEHYDERSMEFDFGVGEEKSGKDEEDITRLYDDFEIGGY